MMSGLILDMRDHMIFVLFVVCWDTCGRIVYQKLMGIKSNMAVGCERV